MKNARHHFLAFLEESRQSATSQRMVVLEAFLAHEGHFSSEEFHEIVKRIDPAIGKSTVYRTLKLLVEAGLARSVDFGDNVTRFERDYGVEHHDHLICTICGKSVEIRSDEMEKLQEQVAEKHGFQLRDHTMHLYGICRECRDRARETRRPAAGGFDAKGS